MSTNEHLYKCTKQRAAALGVITGLLLREDTPVDVKTLIAGGVMEMLKVSPVGDDLELEVIKASLNFLSKEIDNSEDILTSIPVPSKIKEECKQKDLSDDKIKKVFAAYMEDLVSQPYGAFDINFENWFGELSDEELEEITN